MLPYVLQEAYPTTLDGWLDGFIRNAHLEREIQIIELAAVVYRQLTWSVRLGRKEEARLYGVLHALSSGGISDGLDDEIPGACQGRPRCSRCVPRPGQLEPGRDSKPAVLLRTSGAGSRRSFGSFAWPRSFSVDASIVRFARRLPLPLDSALPSWDSVA
jgi:hypothetical protein